VTVALVLGLLATIATGIVVAFVKAPRLMCAATAILTLALVVGWKLMVSAHHLGHLPGALRVTRVLYASEESWGFGPGGNEAGFIAYALPEASARRLEKEGLAWLERLGDGRRSPGSRGRFDDWRTTPLQPNPRWQPDPASGRYDPLQYVCAYGFCIDIDPHRLRAVEQAIHSPGSYYAFGRIGMILLVPRTRRVYFLYNG
jgi:hypothetical protein